MPTMTEDIARAAARDAANRQMRAAGRTSWNMDDLLLAGRTFRELESRTAGTYRSNYRAEG